MIFVPCPRSNAALCDGAIFSDRASHWSKSPPSGERRDRKSRPSVNWQLPTYIYYVYTSKIEPRYWLCEPCEAASASGNTGSNRNEPEKREEKTSLEISLLARLRDIVTFFMTHTYTLAFWHFHVNKYIINVKINILLVSREPYIMVSRWRGLATKWLRILSIPSNDKMRNLLVANTISGVN